MTVSIATQTDETNSNFYMNAWAKHPVKMGLAHGALIGGAAVCAFYNREAIKNVALTSIEASVNFVKPYANSALAAGQKGLEKSVAFVRVNVETSKKAVEPIIASTIENSKKIFQAGVTHVNKGVQEIVKNSALAQQAVKAGLSSAKAQIAAGSVVAGAAIVAGAEVVKSSVQNGSKVVLNNSKLVATAAKPFVKPVSAGLGGVAVVGTTVAKIFNFVKSANEAIKKVERLETELASLRAEISSHSSGRVSPETVSV